MKVQLLNDKTGNVTHAVVPYDDWKKIETILSSLAKKEEKIIGEKNQGDGMAFYLAVEQLNSLVNGLIAYYNRELTNIRKNIQTEDYRLFCRKMLNELYQVNDDVTIFDNLDKMNEYIGKYGPLMKKINVAA